MSANTPNDPLFRYQWFLHNVGQSRGGIGNDINVLPVWEDYTGKGVRVAVVDNGVQLDHPDLAHNIDIGSSWDTRNNTQGGGPISSLDNHGTAVAGLIGAIANNGIGGSGVAPNATLIAYRVDFSANPASPDTRFFDQLLAFRKALEDKADIVNNSWGATRAFIDNRNSSDNAAILAVEALGANGREGKGSIVLFANGNYNAQGFDSNLNSFQNNRYVIAVGALNDDDTSSYYSSHGANILVSAPAGADISQIEHQPGSGVLTTDRTGSDGYNVKQGEAGDYAYNFNGTSAATPITSGVVALILEANPDLGYRDVQEILAQSARFVDPAAQSWTTTHSGTWNGGGALFSREYGFGGVNAHAAVRLAEVYPFIHDAPRDDRNLVTDTTWGAIAEGISTLVLNVDLNKDIDLNHIDLNLDAKIANPSHLSVFLVSPSGTRIALVSHPQNTLIIDTEDLEVTALPWPEEGFTLGTKAFWGEQSRGTWKVIIEGLNPANGDRFDGISLTAYGDAHSSQKTFVYTDDFSNIINADAWNDGRALRTTLSVKTGETAVINAAAVSDDVIIDLAAGRAEITGQHIAIASGTNVTKILTGDGNDRIVGDGNDNAIYAGRGENVIDGGDGVDTLLYRGSRSDYNVWFDETGKFAVSARFLSDIAVNVEKVTFEEGTISIKAATDTGLGVGALYQGLLFREIDADGYAYWTEEAYMGLDLSAIADDFLSSDEYANGVGRVDNAEFVAGLYTNLLAREADAEGARYWQSLLEETGASRADLAISFSQSMEYQSTQLTGLFAQIENLGDLWA
ncbi:S8 family serine peptidase [Pseudochelatococcus sp. B33]